MEKEKIVKILISFFAVLFVILIISACYKNVNDHHKKEYLVVNSKIKEAAKSCYLKNDCKGKIKLKDLYEKKYLDTQVDPVTKEDMNENICLEYVNKEVNFCN